MCGPTLPFALTKTYDLIAVNLRDKLELLSLEFFFRTHISPSLPFDFPFFFFFPFYPFFLIFLNFLFNFFWMHGSHCAMCPSLIQVRFYPEKNYFFSVQFILNELNSSHFLTSKIFVKISSLESLTTYHPENHKKFRLSQNWTKFF